MTLSRRKLFHRSLMGAPLLTRNGLLTFGAAALAEPSLEAQTNSQSRSNSSTSAFTVRAGKTRSGEPGTVEGVPHFWNKISAADTGGRLAMIEVTTPAGSGPPMHIHRAQNEWMYLTAGTFGVMYGSEKLILNVGDSFMVPAGISHAYVVLGSEPARHLNLYDPAGEIEAFFQNYDREHSRSVSLSPAEMAALDAKYQMKAVGPPLKVSAFQR